MKKTILIFIASLLITSIGYAEPVETSSSAGGNKFCGCMKRVPVNEPLTINWVHIDNVDGCELKIVHYFYEGLETKIVETNGTTYTFNKLPKSSRHFEIKVRSFNNKLDGTREYSVWISSTDKNHAVFNGEPCGWLIYTTPRTPNW